MFRHFVLVAIMACCVVEKRTNKLRYDSTRLTLQQRWAVKKLLKIYKKICTNGPTLIEGSARTIKTVVQKRQVKDGLRYRLTGLE